MKKELISFILFVLIFSSCSDRSNTELLDFPGLGIESVNISGETIPTNTNGYLDTGVSEFLNIWSSTYYEKGKRLNLKYSYGLYPYLVPTISVNSKYIDLLVIVTESDIGDKTMLRADVSRPGHDEKITYWITFIPEDDPYIYH